MKQETVGIINEFAHIINKIIKEQDPKVSSCGTPDIIA
jgi:hypothetical protein